MERIILNKKDRSGYGAANLKGDLYKVLSCYSICRLTALFKSIYRYSKFSFGITIIRYAKSAKSSIRWIISCVIAGQLVRNLKSIIIDFLTIIFPIVEAPAPYISLFYSYSTVRYLSIA